ncbi:unnamed protein product [Lampetra fluviatilis]
MIGVEVGGGGGGWKSPIPDLIKSEQGNEELRASKSIARCPLAIALGGKDIADWMSAPARNVATFTTREQEDPGGRSECSRQQQRWWRWWWFIFFVVIVTVVAFTFSHPHVDRARPGDPA